jgi:uncharacterized protein involved in type VI secretion and phage assembly
MTGDDLLPLLLEHVRSRYFGKYRGTVVANDDPTQRARLKVRVPAVLGELELWAMPCVPYAGPSVGWMSLPPVGAGVWVEFEAGDPSFPIWVGCFWADGEAPEQGKAAVKIWKTDSLTVRLDDGNDAVLVKNSSQASVELTADLVAEAGQSKVTIGSDGVISESGTASHKVEPQGVTSDGGGVAKLEITPASFRVNSGAFEVA